MKCADPGCLPDDLGRGRSLSERVSAERAKDLRDCAGGDRGGMLCFGGAADDHQGQGDHYGGRATARVKFR
jgi:hypothetical protein